EARDKKLKGVYCQACAQSVMTLEFQAVKLPAEHVPSSSASPPPSSANRGRKSSRIKIPAAAPLPAEARRNVKASKPETLNLNPLAIAGSGLVLLVVVGAMALGKGSPSNKVAVTSSPPKSPEIRPTERVERTPSAEQYPRTPSARTPAQPAATATTTSDPLL